MKKALCLYLSYMKQKPQNEILYYFHKDPYAADETRKRHRQKRYFKISLLCIIDVGYLFSCGKKIPYIMQQGLWHMARIFLFYFAAYLLGSADRLLWFLLCPSNLTIKLSQTKNIKYKKS